MGLDSRNSASRDSGAQENRGKMKEDHHTFQILPDQVLELLAVSTILQEQGRMSLKAIQRSAGLPLVSRNGVIALALRGQMTPQALQGKTGMLLQWVQKAEHSLERVTLKS